MSEWELNAIWLTIKLASVSTVLLLVLSTPLALWLSRRRNNFSAMVEALVALPLILPPTVLGFYLLIVLAPQSPIGQYWQALTGTQLAFSFNALVIGSVIYSLPFVVQPLQAAFARVPQGLLQAAATLGATPFDQFRSVILPMSRRSFITAASLGFGETQVISIAIYDQVESLQFGQAHRLAAGLVIFSAALLFLLYRNNRETFWRLPR